MGAICWLCLSLGNSHLRSEMCGARISAYSDMRRRQCRRNNETQESLSVNVRDMVDHVLICFRDPINSERLAQRAPKCTLWQTEDYVPTNHG